MSECFAGLILQVNKTKIYLTSLPPPFFLLNRIQKKTMYQTHQRKYPTNFWNSLRSSAVLVLSMELDGRCSHATERALAPVDQTEPDGWVNKSIPFY